MMATDFETIKNDLYGGEAQIVTWPITYVKEYADAYYGMDEQGQWPSDCPESVKELYSYNPEKARALLKEAGYPQGFKTNVIFQNEAELIDYFSIYKDMWAKVGIDLKLDVRESAVKSSIAIARKHEALLATTTAPVSSFYLGIAIHGTGQYNTSFLDDPIINQALDEVRLVALTDIHQAMRIYREKISKYVLEQAFAIPNIQGTYYTFWWPWIKNYSGERTTGYDDNLWPQYIWLDQELKKSMGH